MGVGGGDGDVRGRRTPRSVGSIVAPYVLCRPGTSGDGIGARAGDNLGRGVNRTLSPCGSVSIGYSSCTGNMRDRMRCNCPGKGVVTLIYDNLICSYGYPPHWA